MPTSWTGTPTLYQHCTPCQRRLGFGDASRRVIASREHRGRVESRAGGLGGVRGPAGSRVAEGGRATSRRQGDFAAAAHLWGEALAGATVEVRAPLHANRSVALLRLAESAQLGDHTLAQAREEADNCIRLRPTWCGRGWGLGSQ
jgi:hypothetical protein